MCGGGRNPSAGCSSQEDFCRSFWTDRAARTLEFSIGDDGCWRSEFKTLGRTPLSMRVRVLMRVEWIVIEAERFLAVYRFLCGPHASVWSVWCPCISQSQRRVVVGVVSFHYGKHHQFCPSHLIILGRIVSWEGYHVICWGMLSRALWSGKLAQMCVDWIGD